MSTHSLAEASAAQEDGADFITFGPVFDTPSKRAYGPPLGVESLAALVQLALDCERPRARTDGAQSYSILTKTAD